MFDNQDAVVQNNLQVTQADETSGRPSEGENESAQDRLPSSENTLQDRYHELKLPDSLKGHEENFGAFKKLAATLNLSADTAEKLMKWEADTAASGAQAAEQKRASILQKWTSQTKELFGASYPREIARALDAATRFGGPELRELLDITGLGSHPVIVKTFHQISQQISEDSSVAGKTKNSTDKTFAEALYGKAH